MYLSPLKNTREDVGIKKRVVGLLCFIILLAWSFVSNPWYNPSWLKISGITGAEKVEIAVQWDSGNGINSYETRHVRVEAPFRAETKQHIKIRALGEKHPHSGSDTVSLLKLYLDGKEFELTDVRRRSIFHDRLAIHLDRENPTYEFYADVKDTVRIVFANSNYFGKVEVEINGVRFVHDLYTSSGRYDERAYDFYLLQPDGGFTFSVNLPRYKVKRLYISNEKETTPLSLNSVSLCQSAGCEEIKTEAGPRPQTWLVRKPNESAKQYFDPVRFAFRCIFAVFTTFMLFAIFTWVGRCGGLRSMLVRKQALIFACFFLPYLSISILFLLPFWPGVMSQDSLVIWRASGLPEIYLNDHPVLNQLLYMYLRGIWNHPAIVPIAQILGGAVLTATVFYTVYRKGASVAILAVLYVFVLGMLPIFLFNIMLWKDVPYALLVVFWGLFFSREVISEDRPKHGIGRITFGRVTVFLSFLFLCFLRHNGLVYLAVVPVFMLLFSPGSLKRKVQISLVGLLLGLAALTAMSQIKSMGGVGFLRQSIRNHTLLLAERSIPTEIVRITADYLKIFDMEKGGTVSDRWHFYLKDRYSWKFLEETGLYDYYPYSPDNDSFPELRKGIFSIYEWSLKAPWNYLVWNPVHMLIVLLIVICCGYWLKAGAVYSAFLLCGILPLLALDIFNWRYYYPVYLGMAYIMPIVLYDLLLLQRRVR